MLDMAILPDGATRRIAQIRLCRRTKSYLRISAGAWRTKKLMKRWLSLTSQKERTHESRRRVPLRLHQGRSRRGPGEDYGLPLHGLPSRQWLRLPRQCSRSGCDLSHNGPAGDIPQDHRRERQSTLAGVLSALRLTDLFDIAG